MTHIITFKQLIPDDCKQLHEWLQLSHIREFWDDGDRALEQVYSHYIRDDGVKRFLFLINDQPAGFIQYYSVDDDQHKYRQFSLKNITTLGVDYFIGNTAFLGMGLAILILKDFISLLHDNVQRIIVDPDPTNFKAIHIYKNFGFRNLGIIKINNKLHQLMDFNLIIIRSYKETDAPFLSAIYFNTIHKINIKDYSQEQVNAWAPESSLDAEGWINKWKTISPIVATINNKIVGFAELEDNVCIPAQIERRIRH